MLNSGPVPPYGPILLLTRGNNCETTTRQQASSSKAVQPLQLEDQENQRGTAAHARRNQAHVKGSPSPGAPHINLSSGMPCYHPLDAYQEQPGAQPRFDVENARGKRLKLPCGKCIGCKLERSRQWAVRLMHEAQLHEKTAFVNLTYNTTNYTGKPAASLRFPRTPSEPSPGLGAPEPGASLDFGPAEARSLNHRDFQLFMKKLRRQADELGGSTTTIRYFMCGEYGDKLHRPHYHIALFGEDFSGDRYPWSHSKGNQLYRSPRAEALWTHGHVWIGELTFESAAYVARYITKKITGDKANEHYKRTDNNGNDYWLQPEYAQMSRRPGIGSEWLKRYRSDVYPHDHVIMRGAKQKPPRYYDEHLKKLDAYLLATLKEKREHNVNREEQTKERLRAREACALARLNLKTRPLE